MEVQLPDAHWTGAWRAATHQLRGRHMWGGLAFEVGLVAIPVRKALAGRQGLESVGVTNAHAQLPKPLGKKFGARFGAIHGGGHDLSPSPVVGVLALPLPAWKEGRKEGGAPLLPSLEGASCRQWKPWLTVNQAPVGVKWKHPWARGFMV